MQKFSTLKIYSCDLVDESCDLVDESWGSFQSSFFSKVFKRVGGKRNTFFSFSPISQIVDLHMKALMPAFAILFNLQIPIQLSAHQHSNNYTLDPPINLANYKQVDNIC